MFSSLKTLAWQTVMVKLRFDSSRKGRLNDIVKVVEEYSRLPLN